jgi:hypothetical protein
MKMLYPVIAGLAYFVLGGLWFTPLFGKAWGRSVGFSRPPKWRPSLPCYLGPLMGCMVAAFAMYALLILTEATALNRALIVGGIADVGFSASVTSLSAISPNVPHPALYVAVVGGYHFFGTLLSAAIIHWLGT